MATSGNNREVRLALAVDTSGEQGVKDLALAMRGLGTSADASTPEIARLVAEQEALAVATKTAREAEAAARSQDAAATAAYREQRNAIALQKVATDEVATSLLRARIAQQESAAAVKAAATEARLAAAAEQALAEKLRATVAAAAAAGNALQDAFTQTGVRSAAAISDEVNAIGAALVRLRENSTVTGAEFDRAFTSGTARIETLRAELAGIPGHIDTATKSTGLLSEGIRSLAAIAGGLTLANAFIDANTQSETLRRTLVLVTGSTEAAAQQMAFLRRTADDSGVAVNSLSGAYGKFLASAASAGVSLDVVNRTFAAVTKASGLLGLSSEDTGAALTALGQSASKGKVSLEELQQQLGDRLPAVLSVTASGLNLTTAELTKLIESGQLLADNSYFTAFADGLEKTFVKGAGQVQGFSAELGRFKNVLNDTFTGLGQAGVIGALTDALRLLGNIVTPLGAGFVSVGKGMGVFAAATVDVAGKLLTLDFRGLASSARQFGEAIEPLTQKFFALLPDSVLARLDSFGIKTRAAATEAQAGAGAVGALGTSTTAAASAASAATDQWVKLTVVYSALIASAKQQADAFEKVAAATQAAGAAAVALAQIGGNEVAIRTAATAAAEANSAALARVASARESEANFLQIQIAALEEEAKSRGTLTAARQKELETLQQALAGKQAEAAKAIEAAEAARVEAVAKAVLVQTNKDNSASLAELRSAYEVAASAATAAQAAEAAGLGTKQDTAKANRDLAAAEALYHDALDDTVAALDRKASRAKLENDLTLAKLNLQKSQIQSEIDLATLNGDSARAVELAIKLKQNEIAIIEAKIAATKLEAQATIAGAEATKAAALAEGKLTEAKQLEIDAAIAGAKVKLLEADASETTLKVLQKQIENLRLYGDAAGAARSKSTASLDGETSALGRNTQAQQANAAALAEVAANLSASYAARNSGTFSILGSNGYDAQGFAVDSSGNRISSSTQANVPAGGSFDVGAFNRDSQLAAQTGGAAPDPNNPRYIIPAGKPITGTAPTTAAVIAAYQQAGIPVPGSGVSTDISQAPAPVQAILRGTSAPAPAPAPAVKSGGSSVNVNITINGTRTALNVASQADANLLVSLLKQLETAAKAAGAL